jgi:anti-anti-sigma factor
VTILEVETREEDSNIHVSLRGELDLSTVEKVEQELRRAERSEPSLLVIDLGGLSFIDSTGLRTIVTAHQRAQDAGRRLVIVKGPDTVHRVFTITRLDERLDMVDDGGELV